MGDYLQLILVFVLPSVCLSLSPLSLSSSAHRVRTSIAGNRDDFSVLSL